MESSEYLGRIMCVFRADGRVPCARITAYHGASRSAEVYLAGGWPKMLSAYVVVHSVMHPEGARMWLDGVLLMDEWLHASPPPPSAAHMLQAASPAHLYIEYRQMGGEALVKLEWKAQIATLDRWLLIPSHRLFYDVSQTTQPLSIV